MKRIVYEFKIIVVRSMSFDICQITLAFLAFPPWKLERNKKFYIRLHRECMPFGVLCKLKNETYGQPKAQLSYFWELQSSLVDVGLRQSTFGIALPEAFHALLPVVCVLLCPFIGVSYNESVSIRALYILESTFASPKSKGKSPSQIPTRQIKRILTEKW